MGRGDVHNGMVIWVMVVAVVAMVLMDLRSYLYIYIYIGSCPKVLKEILSVEHHVFQFILKRSR